MTIIYMHDIIFLTYTDELTIGVKKLSYYLTFDVGTTAMKCIIFDEKLHEVKCVNEEYDLITEKDNFVEAEANIYFDTFLKCIDIIYESGIKKDEIKAITFSTQGETFIPTDKNGNALRRAIVWLDSRADKEADFIKSSISKEKFYSVTGLPSADGALPIAKLLWLYRNEPEICKKTYKFFLLEDFFIYKLTGRAVSEKSLVSSTGWYDIFNDTYYSDIISLCGIEEEKLPKILPCGTAAGKITPDAARKCNLSENTVVVTGAMDQIASAIGAGNICEGVITETTGTALVIGATVEKPEISTEKPITVYKHYDDKFMYMPYCNTAGIVKKWFKDEIVPFVKDAANKENVSPYEIIDAMAKKSPPGSGGVILFPHFSGKNEPNEIPNAKGVFFGLQLSTNKEDLARSVLEGIAFMLREIIETDALKRLKITEIHSLGGGSYSKIWTQIKSSVCNKKIITSSYAQTTSLGAAILASVATGGFESVSEAVKECVKPGDVTKPENDLISSYDIFYKKYKKLCIALKDVF